MGARSILIELKRERQKFRSMPRSEKPLPRSMSSPLKSIGPNFQRIRTAWNLNFLTTSHSLRCPHQRIRNLRLLSCHLRISCLTIPRMKIAFWPIVCSSLAGGLGNLSAMSIGIQIDSGSTWSFSAEQQWTYKSAVSSLWSGSNGSSRHSRS
jgi:hypothetical protein